MFLIVVDACCILEFLELIVQSCLTVQEHQVLLTSVCLQKPVDAVEHLVAGSHRREGDIGSLTAELFPDVRHIPGGFSLPLTHRRFDDYQRWSSHLLSDSFHLTLERPRVAGEDGREKLLE